MRLARKLMLLFVFASIASCSGTAEEPPGGERAGGEPAQTWTVLAPQELDRMVSEGDVFLVNTHVPYEGELPGTDAFIPYTEIASRLDELPFGEQEVVIYCRSGNMSTQAARAMVAAGAPAFYELGGGWYAWQDAGLPFEVK